MPLPPSVGCALARLQMAATPWTPVHSVGGCGIRGRASRPGGRLLGIQRGVRSLVGSAAPSSEERERERAEVSKDCEVRRVLPG